MVGPSAVWVEGPPREPRPFGLFSAAQVVDMQDQDGEPAARILHGTRYEVDYCGEAYDSAGICWDFGTLSIEVDAAGEATITAEGYPDGSYQITWGDETEGEGPETVADLDGATHTYADPGEYSVSVAGPQSYGAVVTIEVVDAEASEPVEATVGITKQQVSGVTVVEGEPFVVMHMLECNPVGREDLRERARNGLIMGEQRAVERVVATALARHPDAEVLASGAQLSVVDGLATLEKYAAANYPGRATIHATPDVVTLLDAAGAVKRETINGVEVIATVQGTKVVSGGGYSPLREPSPPDPDTGATTPLAANAADEEWLYVTGAVQVRRTAAVEANAAIDGTAGTSARNSSLYLAERPYVVTWDCLVAAVQVNTTQDGPA